MPVSGGGPGREEGRRGRTTRGRVEGDGRGDGGHGDRAGKSARGLSSSPALPGQSPDRVVGKQASFRPDRFLENAW